MYIKRDTLQSILDQKSLFRFSIYIQMMNSQDIGNYNDVII